MEKVMEKQKRIALIAHDHLKDDLVKWCVENKEELKARVDKDIASGRQYFKI